MTEAYVSFEVAKLLKEKGFNESVRCWYDNFQDFHEEGVRMRNTDCLPPTIMCPTHQMAMKWLREEHQIAIVINCWFGGERYISWHGTIMCYGEELKTQQDVELSYVATYEEAVEAALKYTLENLIKGEEKRNEEIFL